MLKHAAVPRALSAILLSSSPEILSLVQQGLRPVDVESYPTGADAVARLLDPQRPSPRLIVIDFSTASDGLHFVSFVKSSGPTSHLPVIGVIEPGENSGVVVDKDVIGLADILAKPFTADDIANVARAVS